MVIDSALNDSVIELLNIAPGDRWRVYEQLEARFIPSWFTRNGLLWVHLLTFSQALQLRDVIREVTFQQVQILQWLDEELQSA